MKFIPSSFMTEQEHCAVHCDDFTMGCCLVLVNTLYIFQSVFKEKILDHLVPF